MGKQYLKPGMTFTLHGGPVTVGISCSVADLSIDWTGVEEYDGKGNGIGDVVIHDSEGVRWSFKVYRDIDGRLFYDDEEGF